MSYMCPSSQARPKLRSLWLLSRVSSISLCPFGPGTHSSTQAIAGPLAGSPPAHLGSPETVSAPESITYLLAEPHADALVACLYIHHHVLHPRHVHSCAVPVVHRDGEMVIFHLTTNDSDKACHVPNCCTWNHAPGRILTKPLREHAGSQYGGHEK